MTPLVPIAMFGWPLVVGALFARLRPRRAVVAGVLMGWLFLPVASYPIPGLPDYDKTLATCLVVFVAAVASDRERFRSLRPTWLDLPVALLCAAPFAASLRNGLGAYDGLSAAFDQTVTWGMPYILGRAYFGTLDGLRDLASGVLVGGLVYVPLCWFELFRGPQLHRLLYGYHQHSLEQAIRFGGWRPMVLMDHGLMVALWMAACTVVAFWLWRGGSMQRLWRVPLSWWVIALLITTVALKSVNAWLLLPLGVALLVVSTGLRRPAMVWLVIMMVLLYVVVRGSGLWNGEGAVGVAARFLGGDKGMSLTYRFDNENLLAEKARQQPLLGWGRWGRHLLFDSAGNPLTVAESVWIITFGQTGLVGLAAVMGLLLLPQARFLRRYPARLWAQPQWAPAAALVVVLCLYALDNLLNAMLNPVYLLAAGGVMGLVLPMEGVLSTGPGEGPGEATAESGAS